MKKLVYNFVVLTIVSCTLTLQAYYITLFTKDKQQFALDSDLLSDLWMKEFNYPVDIECQTKYSNTFVYIHTLLVYRSKGAHEKLITYLSNNASSLNEYQVADILNTLAFLKLDTLLNFVLWYCPLAKEQVIVNLCSDDLCQKFNSFHSYLSIKIPLEDDFFYTLNVSANKAWRLPIVQAVAIDMGLKCEPDCLIKKPIELVLAAGCVPMLDTADYSKFFDTFFSTILYLSLKEGKFDDPAFFRNLFEKPQLQSEQNIAAFCNLFDFFEVASLLDGILEYIGFHLGNKAALGNDCCGFSPLSHVNFDELLKFLHPALKKAVLEKCEMGKKSRKTLLDEESKLHKTMAGAYQKMVYRNNKMNHSDAEKFINGRIKEKSEFMSLHGNFVGFGMVAGFLGLLKLVDIAVKQS